MTISHTCIGSQPPSSWETVAVGSTKRLVRHLASSTTAFEFTDRYSVFDWGPMPSEITGKGEAVATMVDALFGYLGRHGVDHHAFGLVDERGVPRAHGESGTLLAIRPVDVVRPIRAQGGWNYDFYRSRPVGVLVPLEVVFRFDIKEGSSILERVGDASYLEAIGAPGLRAPSRLVEPLIEWSTKLEERDRYVRPAEAAAMAGLEPDELASLRGIATRVALLLRRVFEECSLVLHDGKFEFAFVEGSSGSRRFVLVDAFGPDELRFSHEGFELSKEVLRTMHRSTPWYRALREAKRRADAAGHTDWRGVSMRELGATPPAVPQNVVEAVSLAYRAVAARLVAHGRGVPARFDAPDVEDACRALRMELAS